MPARRGRKPKYICTNPMVIRVKCKCGFVKDIKTQYQLDERPRKCPSCGKDTILILE